MKQHVESEAKQVLNIINECLPSLFEIFYQLLNLKVKFIVVKAFSEGLRVKFESGASAQILLFLCQIWALLVIYGDYQPVNEDFIASFTIGSYPGH